MLDTVESFPGGVRPFHHRHNPAKTPSPPPGGPPTNLLARIASTPLATATPPPPFLGTHRHDRHTTADANAVDENDDDHYTTTAATTTIDAVATIASTKAALIPFLITTFETHLISFHSTRGNQPVSLSIATEDYCRLRFGGRGGDGLSRSD